MYTSWDLLFDITKELYIDGKKRTIGERYYSMKERIENIKDIKPDNKKRLLSELDDEMRKKLGVVSSGNMLISLDNELCKKLGERQNK